MQALFSDIPEQGPYGYYNGDRAMGYENFDGYHQLQESDQGIVEAVRKGTRLWAMLVLPDEFILLKHFPTGAAIKDAGGQQYGYKVKRLSIGIGSLKNSFSHCAASDTSSLAIQIAGIVSERWMQQPKNAQESVLITNGTEKIEAVHQKLLLFQLAVGVLIGVLVFAMGWAGVSQSLKKLNTQEIGIGVAKVARENLAGSIVSDSQSIGDTISTKIAEVARKNLAKNILNEDDKIQNIANEISADLAKKINSTLPQQIEDGLSTSIENNGCPVSFNKNCLVINCNKTEKKPWFFSIKVCVTPPN